MELIEPGVQGIAIAELASALTDLGPGGGAAARTDKTRLREVTHTCSYISTIYRVASLKLMGQALPAKISPVFLASPFMNFDTNAKTTDIIMFNSRNLGALIVDERPHVKEWDEPQFGIQNIGIEESYGFGVLNERRTIAVVGYRSCPRLRVQPGCPRRGQHRSEQHGLRADDGPGRRGPDRRQRGAVRPLLIPSASRRARLPSSETAAATRPEHGWEAPAGRGFSSLPGPVLRAPGFRSGALAGLWSLHVAGSGCGDGESAAGGEGRVWPLLRCRSSFGGGNPGMKIHLERSQRIHP